MEVHWFGHGHEDRNDWLRYGLMCLHGTKEVHFCEHRLAEATQFGFDRDVVEHAHRHTSVVALNDGKRTTRILVDSEDSFFWMCPLIANVDLYFCAGYNRKFFVDRTFTPPLAWQTGGEVEFYVRRASELFDAYGADFHKVRAHAPIGPNLHIGTRHSWLMQKARNLYGRTAGLVRKDTPWLLRFLDFETRYNHLMGLRQSTPAHDVVLDDTLWGWPRHRLRLHERLQELPKKGYDIHARLRWSEPVRMDGGADLRLDRTRFPIETGSIGNYEHMLAASRLGVFATGFHYGWRNIVTLAMMLGLPIYTDPFLIQHAWDRNGYAFFFNESGDWSELERRLEQFQDQNELQAVKARNQALFDEYLTPWAIARGLLAEAGASASIRTGSADAELRVSDQAPARA
jgi:hypothetical protein